MLDLDAVAERHIARTWEYGGLTWEQIKLEERFLQMTECKPTLAVDVARRIFHMRRFMKPECAEEATERIMELCSESFAAGTKSAVDEIERQIKSGTMLIYAGPNA